jgi:hypothetical protein
MQVKFTEAQSNGKNRDDKEVIKAWNLIGFKKGEFKELATIRWYMGRSSSASVIYCSIWVYPHDWLHESTAGNGQAGGGGYCKQSAAFEYAINSAGLYSSEPISGRGLSVVEDFLKALAVKLGYKNHTIAKG